MACGDLYENIMIFPTSKKDCTEPIQRVSITDGIRALAFDPLDDSIWVGTMEGYLSRWWIKDKKFDTTFDMGDSVMSLRFNKY